MSHKAIRSMFPTGDRWMIRCRICHQRDMRPKSRIFDTKRECHEWWDAHVLTPEHVQARSPEARAERQAHYAERAKENRLLEAIFGPAPD